MTLNEFFKEQGVNCSAWARSVGLHPQTAHRYAKGRIPQDEATMLVIYEGTDGKVTPNDFYSFMRNYSGR